VCAADIIVIVEFIQKDFNLYNNCF